MIGKKIKSTRILKGYSLTHLAKITGISKSYLSYIERGIQKNPSIKVLNKLAKTLNISMEELMENPIDEEGKVDPEWMDMLLEAVTLGASKEDFTYWLKFIRFKKHLEANKKPENFQ